MPKHQWSRASLERLEGVREPLRDVADRALEISPIDFGITRGMGTIQEQREHVANGKSQTLKSYHLIGQAIDVVPFYRGSHRYAWPFFYPVADAFRSASIELGIPIVWGGAWVRFLGAYPNAQAAQADYILTLPHYRKDPFLDGPHFELDHLTYVPDFSAFPELSDTA